jgi:hypothetical protein
MRSWKSYNQKIMYFSRLVWTTDKEIMKGEETY